MSFPFPAYVAVGLKPQPLCIGGAAIQQSRSHREMAGLEIDPQPLTWILEWSMLGSVSRFPKGVVKFVQLRYPKLILLLLRSVYLKA